MSAERSVPPEGGPECSVDPLLIGADREFLESFPKALLHETRCVPLRRFRSLGLVTMRAGGSAKTLARLQRVSEIRIMAVPALHAYGVDLFLRYWEAGDPSGAPPLWIPPQRRAFVSRLGDALSVRGRIQWPAVLASLLLTSPLASLSPVLIAAVGKEAHAIFLHGTAGLKIGARFPSRWMKRVLERLGGEFDIKGGDGKMMEGKGRPHRGLEDLTGLFLPPLRSPSFIIEPRIRREIARE